MMLFSKWNTRLSSLDGSKKKVLLLNITLAIRSNISRRRSPRTRLLSLRMRLFNLPCTRKTKSESMVDYLSRVNQLPSKRLDSNSLELELDPVVVLLPVDLLAVVVLQEVLLVVPLVVVVLLVAAVLLVVVVVVLQEVLLLVAVLLEVPLLALEDLVVVPLQDVVALLDVVDVVEWHLLHHLLHNIQNVKLCTLMIL